MYIYQIIPKVTKTQLQEPRVSKIVFIAEIIQKVHNGLSQN